MKSIVHATRGQQNRVSTMQAAQSTWFFAIRQKLFSAADFA